MVCEMILHRFRVYLFEECQPLCCELLRGIRELEPDTTELGDGFHIRVERLNRYAP